MVMALMGTMKLLWDSGVSLKPSTRVHRFLQSHYTNLCREIARKRLEAFEEIFTTSRLCPHCSTLWCQGEFDLKLKPQRIITRGKSQNLIDKLTSSSNNTVAGVLTKKQRQRGKWLKKRLCTNLEIQCRVCSHKAMLPLQKWKNEIIAGQNVVPTGSQARTNSKNIVVRAQDTSSDVILTTSQNISRREKEKNITTKKKLNVAPLVQLATHNEEETNKWKVATYSKATIDPKIVPNTKAAPKFKITKKSSLAVGNKSYHMNTLKKEEFGQKPSPNYTENPTMTTANTTTGQVDKTVLRLAKLLKLEARRTNTPIKNVALLFE